MENVKDKLIELFRKKKIKPSYHRLKIAEYLATHKNHPTAEMIYESLSQEIPTLSRTTVYNVLKLLKDKGLVQELNIDDKGIRYDFDISPHAHFKCIICGRVYDLHGIDFSSIMKREVDGHKVLSLQLN